VVAGLGRQIRVVRGTVSDLAEPEHFAGVVHQIEP
jgi:hypothetical protein